MACKNAAWELFFSEFSELVSTLPSQKTIELDWQSVETFLKQFKGFYDVYWKSSEAVSIWEVAGLEENEVRTCAVLKWLLNRHGSHGQGDAFMRCFLECMHDTAPVGCKATLPTLADLEGGYKTFAEQRYCTAETEGCDSRVDIEITGRDFVLFVEAKIRASESNGQLERYANILKNKAANKKHALVFLTVYGYSQDASVVPLSWRQLASQFTRYIEQHMDKNAFGSVCIQQFCEHIANF